MSLNASSCFHLIFYFHTEIKKQLHCKMKTNIQIITNDCNYCCFIFTFSLNRIKKKLNEKKKIYLF